MEVIVLHQPLGGARAVVAVAHGHRQRLLLLEAQAVPLARRAGVEPVAYAPEQLLGRGDLVSLASDQHPQPNQLAPYPQPRLGFGLAADPVARASRPAHPVEIPQRARPAFHVGLEQVERAAESAVTGRGLGLQALDEAAQRLLGEEAIVGATDQVTQEVFVAGQETEIQQLRGRGQIVLRQRYRVGGAEHLVADRERGVPQRIDQGLRERSRLLGAEDLGIDHHHDVGVAPQGDRPPAEAPHRRERDPAHG